MRRAKQLLILLTIFSLSGIGITYAASATGNDIQNFFLGNAPLQSSNLNQVLALLVGPKGPPGVAGVAGRDGIIGMNGLNGLDGAPGATGPAGASVAVVALQVGDVNCPIGGSKLIAGDGTITYVCNGRPGAPGARGADGLDGVGGGISYDTTTIGQGILNIGSCDSAVTISLNHDFTGTDFLLRDVIISDLKGACGKSGLLNVTIQIPIKTSGAKVGVSSNYAVTNPRQIIRCVVGPLTTALLPNAETNTVTISDTASGGFSAADCVNLAIVDSVGPPKVYRSIRLDEISSQDIDDKFGFQIG